MLVAPRAAAPRAAAPRAVAPRAPRARAPRASRVTARNDRTDPRRQGVNPERLGLHVIVKGRPLVSPVAFPHLVSQTNDDFKFSTVSRGFGRQPTGDRRRCGLRRQRPGPGPILPPP